MEHYNLEKAIKVFCVTATSFPDGVMTAHQKIRSLVPAGTPRKYFGLSRPENGVITYKAAAEEIETGEAEKYSCEALFIQSDKYLSITVKDFMNNIPAIGKAFQEILANPGLDPKGYCVEWYLNDTDVQCMVRLGG